jgi:hypothetical protein
VASVSDVTEESNSCRVVGSVVAGHLPPLGGLGDVVHSGARLQSDQGLAGVDREARSRVPSVGDHTNLSSW